MNADPSDAKAFYDREYQGERYAPAQAADKHAFHGFLSRMIDRYGLRKKKCLEIGCGRGAFQNVVEDYTGVDLSDSVRPFMSKPFHACSATNLPFPDGSFDAVWTHAVLEHVPDPERALSEMRRVLRPDGILLLHAAWHCPFYAAQGYPVRAYRDLHVIGKIMKLFAHVHRSPPCRAVSIVSLRAWILLRELLGRRKGPFRYNKLKPNYERFWMSDSDAVNSMDQLETILWFLRRGDDCLMPDSWLRRFFQVSGEIVIRVGKRA